MRFAALALCAALTAACSPPSAVRFDDAHIRPPVPGRDVAVGYFELSNGTDAAIELTGATSPQARAIEIHTHIRDGEMLRMRRLEAVPVPPRSSVQFAPGGHHLMLFGYSTGEDATVTITLQFGNGDQRSVQFAVQSRGERT